MINEQLNALGGKVKGAMNTLGQNLSAIGSGLKQRLNSKQNPASYGTPKPVPAPTVFDMGKPGDANYIPAAIQPDPKNAAVPKELSTFNQQFASASTTPAPSTVDAQLKAFNQTQVKPSTAVTSASPQNTSTLFRSAPTASSSGVSTAGATSSYGAPTGGSVLGGAGLGGATADTPGVESDYEKLKKKYRGSFGESEEEKKAREQLDALDASKSLGLVDIENKVIPMQFIAGQQRALEDRGAALSVPLKSKLASLQAQRESERKGMEFDLELNKPKDKTYGAGAIGEYQFAKEQGYTGSFQQYQNEDANRKAKASGGSGGSMLTPYQQFQATKSIQDSLTRNTEDARASLNRANQMEQALTRYTSGQTDDLNATTQVVVNNFNKILDESSVVREGEYSRSTEGQALLNSIMGRANALLQGGPGLTPKSLQEFVTLAKQFVSNAASSVEKENARALALATQFGLNSSLIGVTAPGSSTPAPTPSASQPVGSTKDVNGTMYVKTEAGWVPQGQQAPAQSQVKAPAKATWASAFQSNKGF